MKKEVAQLTKNRSNSERMGLLSNCSSEMGSLSTKLRLGMAFEQQGHDERGLPSCIRSDNIGGKRAVTESIPWLDLCAGGNCSNNSINLIPNQSGFGSPIAVVGGFEHRTPSADVQDGCTAGLVTSFRPAVSTIPGKQLTIFYDGTVNVYDDIPEDMVKAIILMASTGSYSSYEYTKVQNGCGSQTEQKTSVPAMKLLDGSDIRIQPPIPKFQAARKHSRQRFLEERKDRVNAKAMSPYKIDLQ